MDKLGGKKVLTMRVFSVSELIYVAFVIYWILAIILSFKVLIRAKVINSMQDIFFNENDTLRRIIKFKWNKSEFPMIPSNDLMLNFVIFAQKTKYICLILMAIFLTY